MNDNLRYYAAANTCMGYVSFLDEYAARCDKRIGVKNASNECFELLKKELGRCDSILRPGSAEDICCLYCAEKSLIIADEELLQNPSETFAFSAEEADLSELSQLYDLMYSALSDAKIIHDEWEKIYISEMDFDSADKITNRCIERIPQKTSSGQGKNVNRFFGTMLKNGAVNYINELTEGFSKRIFIKGRPGSGKSTLMRKLAQAARERGFDTESYFCSFDPKSFDMVIIRDLGFCIFDATAPHELFPKLKSDETLDLYALCINHETDIKYKDELFGITKRYSEKMSDARDILAQIEEIHLENSKKAVPDGGVVSRILSKLK